MKANQLGPISKALSVVFFSVLISACASKVVDESQFSGYLPNYSGLQEQDTASGGVTLRWISEKIKGNGYHSVVLDKTILFPEPAPTEQVSEMLLRQFSWSVDKALKNSVSGSFKLVEQPGKGVLRIKPAITGVVHSMEGMQALEILPVAMVLGLGKAALGTRDQDVEVYLEVAVTDSVSGELLAKAVRKGEGAQLENDTEKLTIVHLKELVDNWELDARSIFEGLAK